MADNKVSIIKVGNKSTERYPGDQFFKDVTVGLLNIWSITYNVEITFLPYDLKITENLTPEWSQETVIGRMDPIAKFKRMGRTMNLNFKARAKQDLKDGNPYLPYDDLLHCVDHLKKLCYPRYDTNQVMTSPPMFRIKHDLILAGEGTETDGVLCYITTLKADPVMEKNSVFYKHTSGEAFANNGNLPIGTYPKAFDINIGFTVLNENLAEQQVSGVLNKRYFYRFETVNGPKGGHPGGTETLPNNQDNSGGTQQSDSGVNAKQDAAVQKNLQGRIE